MRSKIKFILKYSKFLYSLYYQLFSAIIKFLGLFIKQDQDLVLFCSFGGKDMNDSPKMIFDGIKNYNLKQIKCVWALQELPKGAPAGQYVKIDTLKFFITALRAKYWVTNSSIERGLSFKKKSTVMLNTWHGTPLKRMGSDIIQNKSFRSKNSFINNNYFCVQGEYELSIFKNAFKLKDNQILKSGLPRNDVLINSNFLAKSNKEIRHKYGIPIESKVILYVPTFREFERNGSSIGNSNQLNYLHGIIENVPDDVYILYRAHYEVTDEYESQNFNAKNRLINVTEESDINLLYAAANILLSDYSSVFFDYSLTGKPMICFAYDYDLYSSQRGLYFNLQDYIPFAVNTEDLYKLIKEALKKARSDETRKFANEFINYNGNATELCLKTLFDV